MKVNCFFFIRDIMFILIYLYYISVKFVLTQILWSKKNRRHIADGEYLVFLFSGIVVCADDINACSAYVFYKDVADFYGSFYGYFVNFLHYVKNLSLRNR